MGKNLLLISSLFFSSAIFAQWEDIELSVFAEAILSVEERIPAKTSYSFDASYYFFEELTDEEEKMKMESHLVYNHRQELLNLDQFGKLIVQNQTIQITLDTAYNQIIVNHPNQDYTQRKATGDFDMLLKSECKATRKITANREIYSLQFAPGARYRGAELWIEKEGMVQKYILYSGVEVVDDSGTEEKTLHPRLEIHYDNYEIGKSAESQDMIDPTHFFSDLGNLTPTVAYQDYEIIDLRN